MVTCAKQPQENMKRPPVSADTRSDENLDEICENTPRAEETASQGATLTLHEAATFLRTGVQTIKNYERRGLLRPVGGTGDETLYAVKEVHEILRGKDRKRWSHIKEGVDTTAWMTRAESAGFLRCSPQTLKNYEKRGMVHPLRCVRRDARGHEQIVAIYDPQELRKLPRGAVREYTPREATLIESRGFELFNQGKTIRDVVIELKETYDRIQALHEKWLAAGERQEHPHQAADQAAKEHQERQAAKELEARCFELFSQGKTNREVVIELRETSDRIRELRERWVDDGGADLVISDAAKKAFEQLLGPFRDVTELLERVTEQFRKAPPQATG